MRVQKLIFVLSILCMPMSLFAQGLTYDEQIHDFGHVGIDFKIHHQYVFVNRTEIDIKITDVEVSCDCSSVNFRDSLVVPGDTAFFNLTFETKDYYGPVNKSFTVFTDHPLLPELQYFYVSIVGQWFRGIKPMPISLFYLPSKKSQIIKIPNKAFDEISLMSVSSSQDYFNTTILTEKARKGEYLKIEVFPHQELGMGTFQTTFMLGVKTESDELVMLSIPVKIVKY